MSQQPTELTVLLNKAQAGDDEAAREAWAGIYGELRAMAAGFASKESNHCEPTSVLVEAYLRTTGNSHWENRRHFFGAMRQAMSRFLIDRSRRRDARLDMQPKHRKELSFIAGELADIDAAAEAESVGLLEGLELLEEHDPEAAEVTRLRYIRGLTIEQTADQLGCSAGTVKNRWRAARTWLREHVATKNPAAAAALMGEADGGG